MGKLSAQKRLYRARGPYYERPAWVLGGGAGKQIQPKAPQQPHGRCASQRAHLVAKSRPAVGAKLL
jgi:hypothetical protein